eukprot:scaffold4705_cov108-Cylindrotheca_fusiformis.AAC.5
MEVELDKEKQKEASQMPPSRCPFSGVAIDHKMWETLQGKLQGQWQDGKSMQGLLQAQMSMKMQDRKPRPLTPAAFAHSWRVTISNEQSRRSKELLIDLGSSSSLGTVWDAIYDHPAVKAANVRKWSSKVAANVKAGKQEIRMLVVEGGQMYSLQALREINMFQFLREHQVKLDSASVPLLHLKLVCVDRKSTT